MKKKWIVIGAAALVVVVGSVGAVSMKGRGQKAPEVQTGKVNRQKIVQKVSGTGKIQPKTQVKISADVSARIIKLAVIEGQHVEKGQFLVELDRERYLAMVESGEANVRSANANAMLAKQNMVQAEREFNRSRFMTRRNRRTRWKWRAISRPTSSPNRPRRHSSRRATISPRPRSIRPWRAP